MKWFLVIFLFLTVFSRSFGSEWEKVYLASFPRSGNHWVRYLVEEATHIATSSIYRDRTHPHLSKMFPWGGYCADHGYEGLCRYPSQEDPVLLKTHYPFFLRNFNPDFKKAICLIRNPIDTFWSFHVFSRKEKKSMPIKEELRIFIAGWRQFYEFWEKQEKVLFIRYEDLQENTALYLRLILEMAGFSFDEADIERAVSAYPSEGEPLKHLKFYDAESIEIIRRELSDLLRKYNYAF